MKHLNESIKRCMLNRLRIRPKIFSTMQILRDFTESSLFYVDYQRLSGKQKKIFWVKITQEDTTSIQNTVQVISVVDTQILNDNIASSYPLKPYCLE